MSSVTEEIKARVDLVELIGRSVALKKVGSAYQGLCPFHTEKTPSFYVRPQTQTYRCFGCNKSGSVFDWLMEREHVDFSEALRTLAHMTGVELPERRTPGEEEHTRRLYTILERAQAFYQAALWGTVGQRAREYLTRRGLTEDTQKQFGLGFAPSGNGLLRHLERDGFAEQELQAAGAISVADDGRPYDFFRDRVLFPVRDAQGRTIAFGGRSLEDGVNPKYINTRDTLLFHKQETLFAIDLARRPMGQARQAVIVEGYMDTLMAHQHGYRNVVATLGTAVTDRQLRLLRRHVDEIVLALDADAAGQAATWRALQVADNSLRGDLVPVVGPNRRQQRMGSQRAARLRILALPGAKDPDELIRSNPASWPTLVAGATPVIDFVLQRIGEREDLASPAGKAAAADEIGRLLASVHSPAEQAERVSEAANLLGVEPNAIWLSVRPRISSSATGQATRQWVAAAMPELLEGDTLDEYALALLMRARQLNASAAQTGFEFAQPQSRALAERLDGQVPDELVTYLNRVRQRLIDVERLSSADLESELERTRLRMMRRTLVERKQSLSRLMGDVTDEEERRSVGSMLSQVARDIQSIDEQLLPSERERVGAR